MTTEAPARTPRWATINETAAHLNCSRDTIARMIADGSLKAAKIGKLKRIDLNQLDEQMLAAA